MARAKTKPDTSPPSPPAREGEPRTTPRAQQVSIVGAGVAAAAAFLFGFFVLAYRYWSLGVLKAGGSTTPTPTPTPVPTPTPTPEPIPCGPDAMGRMRVRNEANQCVPPVPDDPLPPPPNPTDPNPPPPPPPPPPVNPLPTDPNPPPPPPPVNPLPTDPNPPPPPPPPVDQPPPPPPPPPPNDPNADPGGIAVQDTPNAGYRYQIHYGDELFNIIQAAYGVAEGVGEPGNPKTVDVAIEVNNFPYNRRFWRDAPPNETDLWAKRISFANAYGTPAQQAADVVDGSRGDGHRYPAFYLPRRDQLSVFNNGQLIETNDDYPPNGNPGPAPPLPPLSPANGGAPATGGGGITGNLGV